MSGPRLLHDAGSWVAVDKPAGTLVIPGRGEATSPVLRDALERQLGRKVFVVHRLDRDTSGVLVFALDASAHRALSMAFEAGKVRKRYLALVEGRLQGPVEIDLPLAPARRGRMRVAKAGEEGKAAVTRIAPLEVFARASLVEAEPLTGRTHQIRVHLRAVGHPLLVDPQYGRPAPVTAEDLGGEGTEPLLTRTPLHASRLQIPSLEGVSAAEVEAPLPDDMARALEVLRRPALKGGAGSSG